MNETKEIIKKTVWKRIAECKPDLGSKYTREQKDRITARLAESKSYSLDLMRIFMIPMEQQFPMIDMYNEIFKDIEENMIIDGE